MPKLRYPRREPTQDWQQLRPLLTDPAQITYEIIRPVLLFGANPKERAAETGLSARTIYYRANLFDQAGMASLLPPTLPPPVPKLDKRTLPPPMRQVLVDLKAEYPLLKIHELATICYVQFGRRPGAQTIKLVLADGPKPLRTMRRFPAYAEIPDPVQRRLAIIRLHAEGWTPTSIAGYLGTSRKTVYQTLKRWAEEQFAGLIDKPHLPHQPARKTSLQAINEVRKLQENPELGAFRIQAALEQVGIKLSRATCGRILALNRTLYNLPSPVSGGRPKKAMPFKAERRHHYWTVDIRYLDMQHAVEGQVYCISILENFSRSILASGLARRQDLHAYLLILYEAVRKCGCPEVLVSDHGGVFLAHQARQIYTALGIEKVEIQKRQSWQSYIETAFNVQRRMADWYFEKAQTWEELVAAHEKWVRDYNFQRHQAHEGREDGRHSPAEVLGWIHGKQLESEQIHRAFAAVCETRRLNKTGYVRFRDFLLYGEESLAGKQALVNLFQETLTLEYQDHPLSRYSVEFQPDDRRLRRVGNPRLYEHPFPSAQLSLWEPGEVEWHVIIACQPYSPRRKRMVRAFAFHAPLFT
jgi:transposase